MSDVPKFRQSLCKVLVNKSPKHAYQAYLDSLLPEKPQTPAQARGSLMDAMLFGIGLAKYKVIDVGNYTTKAGKAARDEVLAEGLIPVKRKHFDEHLAAVTAIRAEMDRHGIKLSGQSQVTLEWDSIATDGTVVKAIGTLDHLILGEDFALILDLKTCEDASDEAVTRKMIEFGSDVQREAYVEAVAFNYPHLAGRIDMRFFFAECKAPYDLNVVEPAGSMRAIGAMRWRTGVTAWAKGLRTGYWSGHCEPGTVNFVEAKPWQINAAMEAAGEIPVEEQE